MCHCGLLQVFPSWTSDVFFVSFSPSEFTECRLPLSSDVFDRLLGSFSVSVLSDCRLLRVEILDSDGTVTVVLGFITSGFDSTVASFSSTGKLKLNTFLQPL